MLNASTFSCADRWQDFTMTLYMTLKIIDIRKDLRNDGLKCYCLHSKQLPYWKLMWNI